MSLILYKSGIVGSVCVCVCVSVCVCACVHAPAQHGIPVVVFVEDPATTMKVENARSSIPNLPWK